MSFKLRYNSPVVLTFALISTIVYFINDPTLSNSAQGGALVSLVSLPSGFDFSSITNYLNLILYVFGHSSIDHLIGNLTFILLLGPTLEEKYGSNDLIIMIIFTAIVTGILNILFFSEGLWGASGIVFMFIILISFANNKLGGIPLTFVLILILFVGKEVIKGFESNNISEFAHIAGGIIGSVFGFISMSGKNTEENEADKYDILT